jgi:site-specific recombinase XerD
MKPSFLQQNLERYAIDRQEIFNRAESGVKANIRDIKIFINYLELQKTNHIDGHVLIEFMAYLKNERNNKFGSINRKVSSIKEYFRYLNFREVEGAENVKVDLWKRALTGYRGPVTVLNFDEVQLILNANDKQSLLGFRDYTIFTLIYRLGLRIGEVRKISLDDINFHDESIQVFGKGRKTRILPLSSDLVILVKQWIQTRKLLLNADESKALFLSKKGNQISERVIQENFQKLVKEVGELTLEKVTPHSLRHAFASHAMDSNCDLITLKFFLGHARLSSTEVYLHPSIETMRSCVNDHVAHDIMKELINQKVIILRVHQSTA